MKIFYVFYHEYERMPIHAAEVIEEMNRRGQQVVVVTAISRQFLQGLAWPDTIQVHQVPIVHLRGLRMISFFLSSLLLLPYWLLKESPNIVYARFSLTSLATLWITRLLSIALVVEVNGIVSDELAMSRTATWRLHLEELVEGWVFRGSDHVITVTEGIRQWVGSNHSVPLEKITTLLNGTNPGRFKPFDKGLARQEFGLDPERSVIGYLGSLYPWCGLEHLIDASVMILEEIPDALFLIGGGQKEMKWELERRVKQLGMEQHFVFQGEVPWDKAGLFISAFDVAVATAQFTKRTGISPLKLYTYLACERPVVGTDLEGLGTLLVEKNVGKSFPVGKKEELAEAVILLLQDKEMATSMGKRGRELVLKSHTWERVVEKTIEILKRCVDSNRKRKGNKQQNFS